MSRGGSRTNLMKTISQRLLDTTTSSKLTMNILELSWADVPSDQHFQKGFWVCGMKFSRIYIRGENTECSRIQLDRKYEKRTGRSKTNLTKTYLSAISAMHIAQGPTMHIARTGTHLSVFLNNLHSRCKKEDRQRRDEFNEDISELAMPRDPRCTLHRESPLRLY